MRATKFARGDEGKSQVSVYLKVAELMDPKQSTCKGKELSQRGGKGLCEGRGKGLS